jgi:hypothetical protein
MNRRDRSTLFLTAVSLIRFHALLLLLLLLQNRMVLDFCGVLGSLHRCWRVLLFIFSSGLSLSESSGKHETPRQEMDREDFNSLFSSPKMSFILITNEEEVRTERKAPNTCRLKSLKQGVVHNKLWEFDSATTQLLASSSSCSSL